MNPTVIGALIGAGGAVVVALAGIWASVRNTSAATEVSRRAVEVSLHAVEAAQQTVELTEQGQVTDRYTKAIEQLGSDKLDVRIGSIYALERIARDSARDHPTIMEVLTAFVREHSGELRISSAGFEQATASPKRGTRPDVQAALTVIGRRNPAYDPEDLEIETPAGGLLHQPYGPNLTGACLADSDLAGANLAAAKLTGADLTGADLTGADLTWAFLAEANFATADLSGADLSYAWLARANLTDVDLTDVVLTNAHLNGATFTGANLANTNLTGANSADADLTGAAWPPKEPAPPGWQRDTDSGRLKRAETNSDGAATDS